MLYANTDDGSSALWVCDGSGVVVDNISIYGEERAPILEQINEHFGTSFAGWSDNEMGLRFGDTIPDWDAYEKIEMPQSYIMLSGEFGDGNPFGIIENDIFKVSSKTQTNCWLCSNNGDIVADINLSQDSKEEMLFHIQHYFPNVEEIEMFIEDFSIGDKITVTDYPWPE